MAARPRELLIRPEAQQDIDSVREAASAFGRPDEARLVDVLRVRAGPFVSLVVHAGSDGRRRAACDGLAPMAALNALGVVVLGHPQYYPKFGFVPAIRFGLRCEYDVPEEAFMALELEPGALGRARHGRLPSRLC